MGSPDAYVEVACRVFVAEQLRKLVKGRDLQSTRTGKLLFHAGHGCVRQYASIRADHSFAILASRFFGVDIHREQSGHGLNRPRFVRQLRPKNFVEIGSRIRGNQQHAKPPVG